MPHQFFRIALILMMTPLFGCAGVGSPEKTKAGRAARNLGQAYLVQGNFTAALNELLRAETIHPDDPVVHNYLGLAYRGKARPNLAAAHFTRALELMPNYAAARNNLGETYLAVKEWAKAISVFQTLSKDMLYATPHFADLNLGWAYFNIQDFATAQKHYQKAISFYQNGISRDINYVKAVRGLGRCYLAQGDLNGAKTQLRKGLALAPDFTPLYLDMARLWKRTGQLDKARKALLRVTILAPDSELEYQAQTELRQLQQQP